MRHALARLAALAVAVCLAPPIACAAPAAVAPPSARAQLIARMSVLEPNWTTPIVPRMTADGDSAGPLAAADSLLSGQPTYINWSTYKNPAVCGSWTDVLFLDSQTIQSVRRSDCEWRAKPFPAVNEGPFLVRGGRHELAAQPDVYLEVCTDYSFPPTGWSGQWVWSPMATTKNVPLASAQGPPPPGYGAQPNSDGYQILRDNAWAWVVASVATDPAINHDLIVYSDPWTGGNTGFSVVSARSSQAAGRVDFVVGGEQDGPPAYFPAVVRGSAASSGAYVLDWTDAAGRRAGAADESWSDELGPSRLANVYEVYLEAGIPVRMDLLRSGGSDQLAFAVFPPQAGGVWARDAALAGSAPFLGDKYDTLNVIAASTGWHPVVVFRDGPPTPGETATYVLRVGPTAVTGTDGGAPGLFFSGPMPSPARASTRFAYGLASAGPVRLAVYDAQGRLVRRLVDEPRAAGRHEAVWDLRDAGGTAVGAGSYWARFEAAGRSWTRRVSVVR